MGQVIGALIIAAIALVLWFGLFAAFGAPMWVPLALMFLGGGRTVYVNTK